MARILFQKEVPERPEIYMPTSSRQGDTLWNLLMQCWSRDPLARPPAAQVESQVRVIERSDTQARNAYT
jgi:hypothetical protein